MMHAALQKTTTWGVYGQPLARGVALGAVVLGSSAVAGEDPPLPRDTAGGGASPGLSCCVSGCVLTMILHIAPARGERLFDPQMKLRLHRGAPEGREQAQLVCERA